MCENKKIDWHTDKKVIISVIVIVIGLFTQTLALTWYASKMDSKIEQHEVAISLNTKNIELTRDYQYKINAKLTGIDVSIMNISKVLDKIEDKLK